jgi:hypothetical protein
VVTKAIGGFAIVSPFLGAASAKFNARCNLKGDILI